MKTRTEREIVEGIAEEIADRHGVTVKQMSSRSTKPAHLDARHELWEVLRKRGHPIGMIRRAFRVSQQAVTSALHARKMREMERAG